jgi:putative heme iron utilization protein
MTKKAVGSGAEPGSPAPLAMEARRLVSANRRGVLSTLTDDDGVPYGSLIEFAPLPDGDVLMFLSNLAVHQRYLSAEPRASLLIAPGYSLEHALSEPRVTLVGRVEEVNDRQMAAAIYLEYHPHTRQYIDFADFRFYRLHIQRARYIAGFGRMGWINGERYRSALETGG